MYDKNNAKDIKENPHKYENTGVSTSELDIEKRQAGFPSTDCTQHQGYTR